MVGCLEDVDVALGDVVMIRDMGSGKRVQAQGAERVLPRGDGGEEGSAGAPASGLPPSGPRSTNHGQDKLAE